MPILFSHGSTVCAAQQTPQTHEPIHPLRVCIESIEPIHKTISQPARTLTCKLLDGSSRQDQFGTRQPTHPTVQSINPWFHINLAPISQPQGSVELLFWVYIVTKSRKGKRATEYKDSKETKQLFSEISPNLVHKRRSVCIYAYMYTEYCNYE